MTHLKSQPETLIQIKLTLEKETIFNNSTENLKRFFSDLWRDKFGRFEVMSVFNFDVYEDPCEYSWVLYTR